MMIMMPLAWKGVGQCRCRSWARVAIFMPIKLPDVHAGCLGALSLGESDPGSRRLTLLECSSGQIRTQYSMSENHRTRSQSSGFQRIVLSATGQVYTSGELISEWFSRT